MKIPLEDSPFDEALDVVVEKINKVEKTYSGKINDTDKEEQDTGVITAQDKCFFQ